MVKSIEEKRKYLYNEGFSRATTLVGTYGTKDYVFVVEGYMDRLKFVQFGEDNVVAILGWKMSHEQIQKLKKKGITKVISALDNDDCGKKGTEFLKKHFEVTRFAYLKGVKDPGEMTQESFDKMLKRTMRIFKSKD
jgi:DNA primase